jgi:hypothetical protein
MRQVILGDAEAWDGTQRVKDIGSDKQEESAGGAALVRCLSLP